MAWTTALDPTVEQVKDTLQKLLDNDNALSDYLGTHRNRVINGCFQVWQRGTSKGGLAAGAGFSTADRFRATMVSTSAIISENQSSSHPLSTGGQLGSWVVTVNTADTTIAAADLAYVRHVIEGYNIADILTGQIGGGYFTVAFWVRSAKTGIHCFNVCNSNGDRSYVVEYTIAAANVWQRVVVTIPVNFAAGGTWNYTNAAGLMLRWGIAVGSNFQTTTTGQWVTGNPVGTANQVNCLDTVNNVFGLADVLLVPGQVAPSILERRPFGVELALCQRYYQKSFPYATIPAQAANAQGAMGAFSSGLSSGVAVTARLAVQMRANPTVTLYNPVSANAQARDETNSLDCIGTAVSRTGDNAFTISWTTNGTGTGNAFCSVQWSAEAEL